MALIAASNYKNMHKPTEACVSLRIENVNDNNEWIIDDGTHDETRN